MIRRELRNVDIVIITTVATLFIIGLLFVYSASRSFTGNMSLLLVKRQITWMCLALFCGTIAFLVDYRRLIDISYFIFAAAVGFLIIIYIVGEERLGAQRWIQIGAFGFQPSEFMKIAFIITLASYLGRRKANIHSSMNMIGALAILSVPFLLIVLQPDLGTALILIPILVSMVLIAGVNVKSIMYFIFTCIIVSPFFWHFLKPYQKKRLLVFINPNIDPLGSGYTIIQSKIGIGSGRLIGKGWLCGTQGQLNFIPERHTDFIFSIIGEEWGFIGALLVLFLFFIIVYRGIRIVQATNDIYGKMIGIGVIAYLGFQMIINIGMTTGLLPVVGVTLPFISYGGSSLVVSVIAVALLLNVGMRRSIF